MDLGLLLSIIIKPIKVNRGIHMYIYIGIHMNNIIFVYIHVHTIIPVHNLKHETYSNFCNCRHKHEMIRN